MRLTDLEILVCPACLGPLRVDGQRSGADDWFEDAMLACTSCSAQYPVRRGIARFTPDNGYADNFEYQWKLHAACQMDSITGTRISHDRFFGTTGWDTDLSGQQVLEVGCGAGRFTEVALASGAQLVSVDMSGAVETGADRYRAEPRLILAQADLRRLPLRRGQFDRLFCLGVLQHTPDPAASFRLLPPFLGPGGMLAIDVYDRRTGLLGIAQRFYQTSRWLRPFTCRCGVERLYRWCESHVRRLWPLARVLHRLPGGSKLNHMLLIPDYRDRYNLSDDSLFRWAVLDLFDALSARYDRPQTLAQVRRWFRQAALEDVTVSYGFNGIVGRGRQPAGSQAILPKVVAPATWPVAPPQPRLTAECIEEQGH